MHTHKNKQLVEDNDLELACKAATDLLDYLRSAYYCVATSHPVTAIVLDRLVLDSSDIRTRIQELQAAVEGNKELYR